jgi:hypothetical protein
VFVEAEFMYVLWLGQFRSMRPRREAVTMAGVGEDVLPATIRLPATTPVIHNSYQSADKLFRQSRTTSNGSTG